MAPSCRYEGGYAIRSMLSANSEVAYIAWVSTTVLVVEVASRDGIFAAQEGAPDAARDAVVSARLGGVDQEGAGIAHGSILSR
jgi:hypothetical protein